MLLLANQLGTIIFFVDQSSIIFLISCESVGGGVWPKTCGSAAASWTVTACVIPDTILSNVTPGSASTVTYSVTFAKTEGGFLDGFSCSCKYLS